MEKNMEICCAETYMILHRYKKNACTYQNICRFYISVYYPKNL